jgi:hypothetical protein
METLFGKSGFNAFSVMVRVVRLVRLTPTAGKILIYDCAGIVRVRLDIVGN